MLQAAVKFLVFLHSWYHASHQTSVHTEESYVDIYITVRMWYLNQSIVSYLFTCRGTCNNSCCLLSLCLMLFSLWRHLSCLSKQILNCDPCLQDRLCCIVIFQPSGVISSSATCNCNCFGFFRSISSESDVRYLNLNICNYQVYCLTQGSLVCSSDKSKVDPAGCQHQVHQVLRYNYVQLQEGVRNSSDIVHRVTNLTCHFPLCCGFLSCLCIYKSHPYNCS